MIRLQFRYGQKHTIQLLVVPVVGIVLLMVSVIRNQLQKPIQSSNIGTFPAGYVDAICSGKENALYYVNGNPLDTYNWRIPELGIEVNNAIQMEVDWNVAGGDYTIQLVKISRDGCSSLIRDTLVMVSQPDPELGSNISLCEGESHTFELDETYSNYTWQDMSNNATFTSDVTGDSACTGYR